MLQLIEISLICTGIHVCFMEGMVFYNIGLQMIFTALYEKFDISARVYMKVCRVLYVLEKPLYDCLPCMASFWTCVILWKIDFKAMLIVCGMNTIIASVLQFFDNSKLPENDN